MHKTQSPDTKAAPGTKFKAILTGKAAYCSKSFPVLTASNSSLLMWLLATPDASVVSKNYKP